MGNSWRQLRAMLRKNWLLKIRHPFVTSAEILLPSFVMLLLIVVRMQVDTQIHPAQSYIVKNAFVEVGSGISPNINEVLAALAASGEYLAFAPDTEETRMMVNLMSLKFPFLEQVTLIYKDEVELDSYISSDFYGACNQDIFTNCSNKKIKGAVVFHEQGPDVFDYSIRLNHTWAFSGFPDRSSIMDVNGPYLNDLNLGFNPVPTYQYSLSGFLTLQQAIDSMIIFAAQNNMVNSPNNYLLLPSRRNESMESELNVPWTQYNPSSIRIVPFPTREFTDDEFQTISKRVMGVIYLLGFLYPISRLISYSVFEKENKIRDSLHMMGLKDGVFHISWFITYTLQYSVSSGIITLCTMNNLFKYSDKSVVFVYFFSFGISSIMLAFLITTFFNRAKTAVAVGTLSFLGAFFPYYTVNDPDVTTTLKVVASLLSPTAFALGSINFADYERAHVGIRWSNVWQESSGVNFLLCIIMMLIDSILYCGVGLYLDKVIPRENGAHYPWNFLFKKQFWSKNGAYGSSNAHVKKLLSNETISSSDKISSKPFLEGISVEMKQQEIDNRCIRLRNLHKVYATKKGSCCAVNSLELNMYENQILALLGHNGAGKSTTIAMLVGILPPTSGDALVYGKNILSDIDEIRNIIGVCPQNDILFPELTVQEHLELFATLKGVETTTMGTVIAEMVDEVGLADKRNTIVSALSGGMKRKLSLGLALMGNSKVIILDEPTSGMDPYSMRLTWQLIKKMKKGRIILLTTHSMDEAEELGDRIAIMANGSLKCCGSSLFLKHHYGVGYTLTLVKSKPSSSKAADIVRRHIPSALCISEAGNEISFKLPISSSPSFESMLREIESCIKSAESDIQPGISDDEHYHDIISYGISVTTLEEVFLGVASCEYDETNISKLRTCDPSSSSVIFSSSKKINDAYPTTLSFDPKPVGTCKLRGTNPGIIGRACTLVVSIVCCFVSFMRKTCCGCCVAPRSTFWKHTKALFIKRSISARRDKKTVMFQLLIPALFLLFGLLFLKIKPHPDQQSMLLETSHFNPSLRGGGGGGPIPFNLSTSISQKVADYIQGGWIQISKESSYKFPNPEKALDEAIEAAGPSLGPVLLAMSEFLMSSFNESYQSRYGAVVMDEQAMDGSLGYTVLHNSSCQHGAPTFINMIDSAILRLATGDNTKKILTRNHPLPQTASQHLQHQDLDAFSAAIIVNIAFSFIPASFALAIVKEREVRAKHQQLISGVSILSYWVSTYIWDFVSFLFPTLLALFLFNIFGLEQFIGADSLLPTLILFLEYGLAIASSTYCLTFFFSDHTMAQNVVLLVHFFSGLILMVISFIMGLIQSTVRVNDFLKPFFRLSPGFCFADGLSSLALLRQEFKEKTSDTVFDWNVTGASVCYLFVESVLFFMLALGLELLPLHKLYCVATKRRWSNKKGPRDDNLPSYAEKLLNPESEFQEDIDVQIERNRVVSGSVGNSILYLKNLRKVYPEGRNGEKIAIHSLSFSVQPGECFGFLGPNGAGKTTTLSILSGEQMPSDGSAHIFGNDISSDPRAVRLHIGYCPQFDALLEFLTAREHLELYARIKGVEEYHLRSVVTEKLVEFDLVRHADKPSFTLSGGNKRKLSVAIAMIGDPPIVILDEPSTGMDPVAKRFMWEVISRVSTRRGKTALILTTHSMNEAQALCTRIGIMVGGRLKCIGSPQHLKTRYGNHLELEIKPSEVSSEDLENLCVIIKEELNNIFTQAKPSLDDPESCIGGTDAIAAEKLSAAEICLSPETILLIGNALGNEEKARRLAAHSHLRDGRFGEELSEQLIRDGGIPLHVFSEWWLTTEKFSRVDDFVLSSFPDAACKGYNGLNAKYQLPRRSDVSLADVFGHLERNKAKLGIAEYSVSQSTLETIFNHFAGGS